MCVHIMCTCVYIYVDLYMYMYICVYMCICICMYICVRAYMYICICKQMSHVPDLKRCPISEWVTSRVWMNQVAYMNESCPIHDAAKSQVWKSRDPYMNEKLCQVTPSYVQHDYSICEIWIFPTWDMTHSLVEYNSFICRTRMRAQRWSDLGGWAVVCCSDVVLQRFVAVMLYCSCLLQWCCIV